MYSKLQPGYTTCLFQSHTQLPCMCQLVRNLTPLSHESATRFSRCGYCKSHWVSGQVKNEPRGQVLQRDLPVILRGEIKLPQSFRPYVCLIKTCSGKTLCLHLQGGSEFPEAHVINVATRPRADRHATAILQTRLPQHVRPCWGVLIRREPHLSSTLYVFFFFMFFFFREAGITPKLLFGLS